jgi:hypothetical protein
VTYTPDWESIRKAADRIAAAGNPKQQAKIDLCLAITDHKIAVRLSLVSPPSLGSRKQLLESPMLEVPRKLVPSDIDWRRSRPANSTDLWIDLSRRSGEFITLHLARIQPFMGCIAESIEVKVADVTRVFSLGELVKMADPKPADKLPKPAPNRLIRSGAVKRLILKFYPQGRPEGLGAENFCDKVNELLLADGLSKVKLRTVQRVLQSLNL